MDPEEPQKSIRKSTEHDLHVGYMVPMALLALTSAFSSYYQLNQLAELDKNKDSLIAAEALKYADGCARDEVFSNVEGQLDNASGPVTFTITFNREAPSVQKCALEKATFSYEGGRDFLAMQPWLFGLPN